MKKRHVIKFPAFFLLLVYIFSISPTSLFHHHELESVSFQNATSCEKASYFSFKDGHCKHESHVAKSKQKCSLCDHHTSSPHASQSYVTKYFSKEFSTCHVIIRNKYVPVALNADSNRGPPSL